ncbi:MAG: 3D domain-containing protein [Deltaproteobacteria bacterium]|nr:3D domain-containing protein [Deltaproteobacteria bacterium]
MCALGTALVIFATGATTHAQTTVRYPGRWQLTQYWIAQESAALHDLHAAIIRGRTGHALAWACPRFVTNLTMEGTGLTWDNRLLNWDGRVNGQACFVEVDRGTYPYGIGVMGYALVPYRSLAVDRRFISIGHTVELADIAGFPLPDGSRHDGCFVAVDGGGAIVGHHIDMFVPSEGDYQRLNRQGWIRPYIHSVIVDSPRCQSARPYAWLPLPSDPALPR